MKKLICLSHTYLYELRNEGKISFKSFPYSNYIFEEITVLDKKIFENDKQFINLILEVGRIAKIKNNDVKSIIAFNHITPNIIKIGMSK